MIAQNKTGLMQSLNQLLLSRPNRALRKAQSSETISPKKHRILQLFIYCREYFLATFEMQILSINEFLGPFSVNGRIRWGEQTFCTF